MFEVVISTVSTGRVVRKLFGTRDEADRYAEARLLEASSARRGTARRIRVEVYHRPAPDVRTLPRPARPAASPAA